jgi:hypothetical protein
MSEFWIQFFNWLERVLPSVLGSLALGYSIGAKGTKDLKKKNILLEIELSDAKKREEILQKNRGRTDSDIIDEALSSKPKMS